MALFRHSHVTVKALTHCQKKSCAQSRSHRTRPHPYHPTGGVAISEHTFPSHTFPRLSFVPATLKRWHEFWNILCINYTDHASVTILLVAMIKAEERPWHAMSYDMGQTYTADRMIFWSCLIVSIQISAVNLSLWPFITAAAKIYTQ